MNKLMHHIHVQGCDMTGFSIVTECIFPYCTNEYVVPTIQVDEYIEELRDRFSKIVDEVVKRYVDDNDTSQDIQRYYEDRD